MFATAEDLAGPSLPTWFLAPATALFALATIYWIARTQGRAARYLIFACWLRFTLGALHEITYQEAFFGLRWVAVGSIGLIAMGLVALDKRRIFSRPFVPVMVICGLMAVSAILNQIIEPAIDPFLRILFFVLTAVALWQALETNGSKVLGRLLFVFVQPITFQIASIVLGIAKAGELDASISYIGGYYHEELFSLILATAFLTAILATKLDRLVRGTILILSLVGIYLSNYRTTILGVLPLAATFLLIAVPRAVRPGQRVIARWMVIAAMGIAVIVGGSAASSRFSDLAALTEGRDLFKPPETFTYEDQRVLSARPYIWSQYLYAYGESPKLQKIIGHGPDSWVGKFPLYAHNTVISFLYELGVVGVAALLWLWGWMFWLALKTGPSERPILISGHASFFLLNMATMPHWQIEGNIFYGLLCGYTIAKERLYSMMAPEAEDEVPIGAHSDQFARNIMWPVPAR